MAGFSRKWKWLVAIIAENRTMGHNNGMNILEASQKCIQAARASRAANTAHAYAKGINTFFLMLEQEKLDLRAEISSLTSQHFISFPAWLLAQGYAKKTNGVYLAGVRFFMDWMVINGFLEISYSEQLRLSMARKQVGKKREERLPRFPARDSVDKMRQAVHQAAYPSPLRERNIALIEVLVSTGCRVSEIAQLRVMGFENDLSSALVIGKGNKERRVFVNEAARSALRTYWLVRGNQEPNAWAFARHDKGAGSKGIKKLTPTTIRNVVKEVATIAGLNQFSPHYFRHAFAIRVLGETGNLALAQDLLGHASPSATRVYAKIYPEDLKTAHQKIFK